MLKESTELTGMRNLFPVTKSLAFRILPIGKTRENIEKNGVLEEAEELQKDYKVLKVAADRVHKRFIEDTLKKLHLKYLSDGSMDSIQEYAELFENQEDEARIAKVAENLKASVTKAFNEVEYNEKKTFLGAMASELLVKEILAEEDLSPEEREALGHMRSYTTYMRPYFTKRAKMYDSEEKGHTIPVRIVDDNLPIHLKNKGLFERLPESVIDDAAPVFNALARDIPWAYELRDLFTVSAAACLSAQSSIDAYNAVIGGIGLEDGSRIKGLNELINLHNQAHAGEEGFRKIPLLAQLKKQILSDRSTPSWIPEAFTDDTQLLAGIEGLHAMMADGAGLSAPGEAMVTASAADPACVLVSARRLSNISQACTGNWNEAERCLKEAIREENPQKKRETPKGYNERINKLFKSHKSFTFDEISSAVLRFGGDGAKFSSLSKYISKAYAEPLAKAAADYDSLRKYIGSMSPDEPVGQPEGNKKDSARAVIKAWLDDLMDAKDGLLSFTAGSGAEDIDADFYERLVQPAAEFSETLVPLYNKVRNYLTQKPYSTEKKRLYFGTPTLLAGWDRNKEETNRGILIKDGTDKYLAILPAHAKKLFTDERAYEEGSPMQRMSLKYIPGPSKMLPKVGFSGKAGQTYNPSEEVLAVRNGPKKVAEYDSREVALIIDYYKHVIKTNPEWADLNFTFKDTAEYERLNDFFVDVDSQAYFIEWKGLSRPFIERAVEKGNLYLFKITGQDMSEAHHGTDGNYKAIIDEAFSGRNVTDTKIRISGNAAIYYRDASIPERITHPANVPINNKNPNNPRATRTLHYDLTKDKRFTREYFSLHIPVLLQPDADSRGMVKVNEAAREAIRQNPGMYVLGINRGERNLVSIAVTAPDGSIVEQRHLNVFDGFDYSRKLAEREEQRTEDRRNWNEIEDIRKLKAGYLSRVTGEIVRLVKKYNCVVALEALDSAFRQGRQRVEKNVYQQFERDLVGRLSFLMDRHDQDRTRNILQLASPGKNIEERTKYPQNGIVFFLSPSWITKTDPLTGFANKLNTYYESISKSEKIISCYESFRFLPGEGLFALAFSYSKTNPGKEAGDGRVWTVCTNGVRTDRDDSTGGTTLHVLTDEMRRLLEGAGVAYEEGQELLPALLGRSAEFYREFFRILRLTLQNTIWDDRNKEYRLVSCTSDASGRFFDSATAPDRLPKDPDINAAWNIARKAHIVLRNIREFNAGVTTGPDGKVAKGPRMSVSDAEWFAEVQK